MRAALCLVLLAACRGAPATPAIEAKQPLTMTYLGVAGWQIECAGKTILVDPYFSRPALDGVIASDPAAVAAHAPKKADLILVGHSHVDHLLDVPAAAVASGAQVMGSASTIAVARSRNVASDHLITVRGGEDYQFEGFSVRVIPSLHSALDHKHATPQGTPITVIPPVRFDDYQDGGTLDYLVRVGGHEIFVSTTANFIERELDGLRPDVAIIATGLRHEITDYSCRLMRLLNHPSIVLATHFDDWKAPPVDVEQDEDLADFKQEIVRCSSSTRVIVPKHFVAEKF